MQIIINMQIMLIALSLALTAIMRFNTLFIVNIPPHIPPPYTHTSNMHACPLVYSNIKN
jgi:hypothetical protein